MRDFIVNVMMYSVNRDVLAFDGAADLKRFIRKNGAVNIVVSDAHLPDAPEFELLKMIKATSPSTYFIVLSGDPTVEAAAAALGADAFLAKPFTLRDLFSIVERFVVSETA